jgi:hypothetical protein
LVAAANGDGQRGGNWRRQIVLLTQFLGFRCR